MCGIFGAISESSVQKTIIRRLAIHSEQRGKDSSGLLFSQPEGYRLLRATNSISNLLNNTVMNKCNFVMGHSRLITNGLSDNQPVYRDGICVIHNGIVVNHDELWRESKLKRCQQIDTEIIAAIAAEHLEAKREIRGIANAVTSRCKGIIACALAIPSMGKLLLFSNNGSLYFGTREQITYFASESYTLTQLGCENVIQIREGIVIDLPKDERAVEVEELKSDSTNLIPNLGSISEEERLLVHHRVKLRRCNKCILPETMPYITFDNNGICNYCSNYQSRNKPRPVRELLELVESYRRKGAEDCIVPFSGGRDSCYGLHLIIKELKMKPITYTYDWGMVTDLGRRNISRMCGQLGVENIIVADDIRKKRRNIALNLKAWLKSPHLGMISILTAGDKHFFRYVEKVKKQTGISLNLWGVNPLEVTHFKAGFLGLKPDFEEKRVYNHGFMKQVRYQSLRFKAMLDSPGYFNRSIWDTITGEYFRSFTEKTDYYHIFDFWRWDEGTVDTTLEKYDWEKAPDTNSTWRIGDGTAALYNYIYYFVAGFTEHDTFRSNQIREGDLTREEALALVEDENRPRYPNIKWYLDAVGMDFKEVIKTINKIKPIY